MVDKTDPESTKELADLIKNAIKKYDITTRNVALSLPSKKIFCNVVDFEDVKDSELKHNIKTQAPTIIPTPIEESKIDWVRLGPSPNQPGKIEVLINSVENYFIEQRLDMIESVGLRAIAFEPRSLASVRSVIPRDDFETQVIVDINADETDIVFVDNQAPKIIRALPISFSMLTKTD